MSAATRHGLVPSLRVPPPPQTKGQLMPCFHRHARLKTPLAAALAALPAFLPAQAAPYPEHAVTIVVPFSAGGSTDAIARAVAQRLGEALGKPVVVENKAGAAGAIGSAHVARAKPDGHTLLVGSDTTISIRPQLSPPAPYDPARQFVPVGMLATAPIVFVAAPNTPASSVRELVDFSKQQQKPLSYADSGVGTPHYLIGELFKQATGIDITHIGYKGGGEKMNDVLAGHVQFTATELGAAAPYFDKGQLKPIGIATAKRHRKWPDLPTLAEQGVTSFDASSWFGIFAPAGTPAAVVDKLNAELRAVLSSDRLQESFDRMGFEASTLSQRQFADFLVRDRAKWAKAIKASGTE